MIKPLSKFRSQTHLIANKWYHSQGSNTVEMQKRGGSSANDSSSAIQEIVSRIEASIFPLTSTNYRLWAMRIEVYLEAHGLWEAITRTKTNQKKDRQALLEILNFVSESMSVQLDFKKIGRKLGYSMWG